MDEPVILTVTMNPAVDVAVAVEYLVPDHKLEALDHRRDAGGGGVNVSRVSKRLGLESRAWIAAGGPTGDELTELLDAEGISPLVHRIDGSTRESISITDTRREKQYRIVVAGPAVTGASRIVDEIVGHAGSVDVVVLSGSLPPGVSADFYATLCEHLPETIVVVDTKGEALASVVHGRADVVKPSRRELASLVDWTPADSDEIVIAARKVLDRGDVGALAVSLGGDGAVLVERTGQVTWYRPPTVDVVSTVGSGDSMVAGIAVGLARRTSLVDAVTLGVAAGTAAVLTAGTDLCREEDVERILPQVVVGTEPPR